MDKGGGDDDSGTELLEDGEEDVGANLDKVRHQDRSKDTCFLLTPYSFISQGV